MNNIKIKIMLAQARLKSKLSKLDISALGLSEYNQRYLANKLGSIEDVLQLYGNHIWLSLKYSSMPLSQFILVDYGGGSGVMSLLAKEMGIGTVVYSDIYGVSCHDVECLGKAIALPIDHIVCGDLGELLSYVKTHRIEPRSITSYDVLEHIYDVEDHFQKLPGLSSKPFRLVYGSGANIENQQYVKKVSTKQIAEENEDREMIWGHKKRDTLRAYVNVRKEIITNYAAELHPGQVDELALRTRGLIEEGILECTDEYLKTGNISYKIDHPTNTCDPYTGNWCEHLMDLEWIQEIVKGCGFSAEIRPGYYPVSGKLRRKRVNVLRNIKIKMLGRSAMYMAPYYVVCADYQKMGLST